MNKQLHTFQFSIKNQTEPVVDIYIDGHIVDSPTLEIIREYWGDETSVSFKSFRDQITKSSAKEFNIYINSGGGHIGDAMAMHDLIVEMESRGYVFNSKVMGICASAATYPAMASKNSEISANSWFMIHNASGAIWGDVDTIENYARTMRKFNDRVVSFYAEKTGISQTVIGNMMKKETWLTAQEAVEKGFISKVTSAASFKNAINPEHWMFNNMEVLNLYNSSISNPIKNVQMDLKKIGQEIINGITKVFTEKGVALTDSDPALTNLSTTISNALNEGLKNVPTTESIQNMIDQSIQKATEGDADAISNAITEGTKGLVKADDIKNFISKDDVSKMISQHLGNRSDRKDDANDGKDKKRPSNRFARSSYYPG
ncbi:MAG TPA: Clp protease ClpP [Ferruginibacter sp.]|nr:Clp protease ClpP [Ferruginibacter sp.]